MKIRIGTDESVISIAQSRIVSNAIKSVFPDVQTELVNISSICNKKNEKQCCIDVLGLAILDGLCDIIVRNAKDMPVKLVAGTFICAALPRADKRDVLITRKSESLPENPIIGANTRRAEGAKKLFLEPIIIDVQDDLYLQLNRVIERKCDGVIVSAAELEWLDTLKNEYFDSDMIPILTIVPAPCQGIIAIQSQECEIAEMLHKINDKNTFTCLETERRVIELLNKELLSTTGAFAEINDSRITLTFTKDQKEIIYNYDSIDNRFKLAEHLVTGAHSSYYSFINSTIFEKWL